MVEANFKEDDEWSKKFIPMWDEFYKSDYFLEYVNGQFKRNMDIKIEKIIRRSDPEWQMDWKTDVSIKLSKGASMQIDEKIRRPKFIRYDDVLAELISNTTTQAQGWGYHKGKTIAYTISNPLENGFAYTPILFIISERFIEEVCRNTELKTLPPTKNQNYWTINKAVPKWIIKNYKYG